MYVASFTLRLNIWPPLFKKDKTLFPEHTLLPPVPLHLSNLTLNMASADLLPSYYFHSPTHPLLPTNALFGVSECFPIMVAGCSQSGLTSFVISISDVPCPWILVVQLDTTCHRSVPLSNTPLLCQKYMLHRKGGFLGGMVVCRQSQKAPMV